MSIFGTIRVPLSEDEWSNCPVCDGLGSIHIGSEYKRCGNKLCEGGKIKYKLRRASVNAIQRAQEDGENHGKPKKRRK